MVRPHNLVQNKTRKDVDRRASKGRRIRYVVHEKLKHFTFPISRGNVSNMDGCFVQEYAWRCHYS